jgi:hypothetical protein
MNDETTTPSNQNNITILNNVSTPRQARGSGTVLLLVFFGWFLMLWYWPLLAVLWLLWLPTAAIVTIWSAGFFSRTWFYPWPAWMFGIR